MPAAKKKKQNKKPRSKAARRLIVCLWLLVLTLVFAGLSVGTIFLQSRLNAQRASGKQQETEIVEGTFAVKSITVEGNSHYSEEAIKSASGLYIGESIWKANKTYAANCIKASLPYIEDVHISSHNMNELIIKVEETGIAGAMYSKDGWILVGTNGNAIDKMEVVSDVPLRYTYIKGAKPSGQGLGKQAMNDKDTYTFKLIAESLEKHKIKSISEIDLTNASALMLNWNNQITINLGNSTNIDHEMAVIAKTLPAILKKHGTQVRGTLDLSSYSNKELTSQAVFTPSN